MRKRIPGFWRCDMKDRRKSYWFLPLCLCFLLFIGGCGSAGEEKVQVQEVSDSETVLEEEKSKDSPLRIGLILSSRDDAENEELEEVFQSLASELGAELSVKTPDVTAAEAAKARKLSYHSFVLCDVNPIEYQMLAVNELVAENADYIVIHGNHGEALEGILASARGVGIQVIALEQEMTEGSFDAYADTAEKAAEEIKTGSAL